MGLLDDRQIGAEIGVEHGVEAQPPQGRDHLAGGRRARRQAKTLADGGADRGAVCITTCMSGSAMAAHTSRWLRFSRKAAVGQTLMHCPHWMQTDSSMLADGRARRRCGNRGRAG